MLLADWQRFLADQEAVPSLFLCRLVVKASFNFGFKLHCFIRYVRFKIVLALKIL